MKKLALIIGILICLPLSSVYSLQDDDLNSFTNTAAIWDSINVEQKIGIITGLIGMHKESGTVIKKEPEFYVEEIELIRVENPEMYVKGIGVVFKALAIMYSDYGNGQDPNELIKQTLSKEDYERYVLNQSSTKFIDRYKEWKSIGVFKIHEDGRDYIYDESYKKYEKKIEADIDGDGMDETIWSFTTTSDDDIRIHLCVTIIYKIVGDKRTIVKTIIDGERPEELYADDFDNDGAEEIVLLTGSGMHYTNINVYQYQGDDYSPIFEDGSANEVYFDGKVDPPVIKVGRNNFQKEGWSMMDEPLWEVYQWNGKQFVYSQELSSTQKVGAWQDVENYVEQYKKLRRGGE